MFRPVYIHGIGTAHPPYRLDQADVCSRLEYALEGKKDSQRWMRRIFKQCGVNTRYTCDPNLLQSVEACDYLPLTHPEQAPSTAERMKFYKQKSVPLAVQAAEQAIKETGVECSNVTHLITVSCTGQFLPGLDAILVQKMVLSPTVIRIPLVFQGCAAGLKAIQLANQISQKSEAVVLIVCVELCTLHLQPSAERNNLYGASFFGDGASACVVSSSVYKNKSVFQLGEGTSLLLPDSLEAMKWELGNTGFDLYLSAQIPKLLEQHLPKPLKCMLLHEQKPELWAIHPGGRGIVDAVQTSFDLTDEQTSYSRNILRDYGNLSSVTILFVLQAMRQQQKQTDTSGIALAFGPGLTAEILSFTYVPQCAHQESETRYAFI